MNEKTKKAKQKYLEVKKEADRIRALRKKETEGAIPHYTKEDLALFEKEKEKGNKYRVLLFRLNGLLEE